MLIAEHDNLKIFKKSQRLMGDHFEFTIIEDDDASAEENFTLAIQEIKRIERLLTTFDDSSQTNHAGMSVIAATPQLGGPSRRIGREYPGHGGGVTSRTHCDGAAGCCP